MIVRSAVAGFVALSGVVSGSPLPSTYVPVEEDLSVPNVTKRNVWNGGTDTVHSLGGMKGTFLSQSSVNAVQELMMQTATHSWEWGYESIILLQMETPELDVYGNAAFPPKPKATPTSAFNLLAPHIKNISEGQLTIVNDTAVGDPASLGTVTALGAIIGGEGVDHYAWAKAAYNQIDYLVNHAPRGDNGAISQRYNEKQFWADFLYMAPPYLAYYGAQSNNSDLIRFAAKQIDLQREYLQDDQTKLWRHIQQGNATTQDAGLWATGNAWIVQGIARVLAVIINGPFKAQLQPQIDSLAGMAFDVVRTVYNDALGGSADIFPNYFYGTGTNYSDVTSTCMMTAAAYRLNVLGVIPNDMMDVIHQTRDLLNGQIEDNGIVTPVVNPGNWKQEDVFLGVSPEGQTAMLAMENAYREWNAWKANPAQVQNSNDFGPTQLWEFTDPLWPL